VRGWTNHVDTEVLRTAFNESTSFCAILRSDSESPKPSRTSARPWAWRWRRSAAP